MTAAAKAFLIRFGQASLVVAVAVAAFAFVVMPLPPLWLQDVRNKRARPFVDSVVSKLNVGDDAKRGEDVFKEAGLGSSRSRELRLIQSRYDTGRGSGIQVRLDLDGGDRVTRITVNEIKTGL